MAAGDPCLMQDAGSSGGGTLQVTDFLLVPEPENYAVASKNVIEGAHDGAHGQTEGAHQLYDSSNDPSADNATLVVPAPHSASFVLVSGTQYRLDVVVAGVGTGNFTIRGSWKGTPIIVFVNDTGGGA